MFFHKTPAILRWFYPHLTWKGPKGDKVIYLTFDDGPVPGITEFILDTLKEYEAKATFFCVGENLIQNDHIARKAIQEGHLLANHTHNHLNGWKTGTGLYIDNVKKCEQQLEKLGVNNNMMRPPYGKISGSQIKKLKNHYRIVMWDVLTGDYSSDISPENCLQKSIKHTQEGSIVLFHDNIKAEANLKYALPLYLKHYRRQGYKFEALCL